MSSSIERNGTSVEAATRVVPSLILAPADTMVLARAVQGALADLKADISANGEPQKATVDRFVGRIVDSMPEAFRQETTPENTVALKADLARIIGDFFKVVKDHQDHGKSISEREIEDIGATLMTTFLKYHTHSLANNPSVAPTAIAKGYDPRIDHTSWIFMANNITNVLLWVLSTATTLYGAVYYTGRGLEKFALSDKAKLVLKWAIGAIAAAVTSFNVFGYKKTWADEVNMKGRGVLKGAGTAFGSIWRGEGHWRVFGRLAPMAALFTAVVGLPSDGVTNYGGFATVFESSNMDEQLRGIKQDFGAQIQLAVQFLDQVDAVPGAAKLQADSIMSEEVAGNNATQEMSAGPMWHAENALFYDAPVDLIVSGRFPSLQNGLRDVATRGSLTDDNRNIEEDLSSITASRVAEARGRLCALQQKVGALKVATDVEEMGSFKKFLYKHSGGRLFSSKSIEGVNAQIEELENELFAIGELVKSLPVDLETRVDLYNGVLEQFARVAQASGAYSDFDMAKLADLELPETLKLKTDFDGISPVAYADGMKLAETGARVLGLDDVPHSPEALWIMFVVLAILVSHGNNFAFLKSTQKLHREDRVKSVEVKQKYFDPRIDWIARGIMQALNQGPFSQYFKHTEPLRQETVRAAIEARIDEIVEEMDRGTGVERFGRGALWVVGLGEVARGSGWRESEVARMHNLRVDAIEALCSEPRNMALVLAKILPGLSNMGEALDTDRESTGSTLAAGRDVNEKHLREENVRLEREELEEILCKIEGVNIPDDESGITNAEEQLVRLRGIYDVTFCGSVYAENVDLYNRVAEILDTQGATISVTRLKNLAKTVAQDASRANGYDSASAFLAGLDARSQTADEFAAGNRVVQDLSVAPTVVAEKSTTSNVIASAEQSVKNRVIGMVLGEIDTMGKRVSDGLSDRELQGMIDRVPVLGEYLNMVGDTGYDKERYGQFAPKSGELVRAVSQAQDARREREEQRVAEEVVKAERERADRVFVRVSRWHEARGKLGTSPAPTAIIGNLGVLLVGKNIAGDERFTIPVAGGKRTLRIPLSEQGRLEDVFTECCAELYRRAEEVRQGDDEGNAHLYGEVMFDALCSDMDLLRQHYERG